jgi:nitronate monooxygenase
MDGMSLATAFTRALSIRYPIVSAPMGESAGGSLAAAVSAAGGLGLIGAGRDEGWLARELSIVRERTDRPWGVGFLTWALTPTTLDAALGHQPAAVMLSFGDPTPFVERVGEAGATLLVQVTDLDEARQALDLGADVIVAQGSDAGGHSGRHAVGTLSFVPQVVDLAGPTPVLAAGGITDGRGLAAALVLGAAGALVGTRFQASHEALVPPELSKALVDGHGADTERSRVLDIARGAPWPERYPGRALTNAFLDTWRGRERQLAEDAAAQAAYRDAVDRGDISTMPVWAGQALDLVTSIEPAGELVAALAAQAEAAISPTSSPTARPASSRATGSRNGEHDT